MPPPSSKPASRASPKAARLASEPSHMAKVDKDRLRPSVSTRTLQFSIIAEETVVTRTYLLHPKAELASLGPSKTSSKAHPTSAKPSTPHTSPSRLGGGVTAASHPPVRTPRTKPYHQSTPSTPHRKVVHPAPASRPATLGSQTSRIVSSPNLTRSPARADGRKEVPKRLGPSPPQRDGSRSSPPALRARSPAAGRASTLNSSHAPPRRSAHTSRSWSVSPPPKSLRSIPSTSSTIPLSPPSLPSLPSLSSLPSLPSPPHPPHQLRAPSPLDVPQPEPHLSPSSIPPEAVPPALTFKVENPSPAAVESPSHPSASDVPFKFKEQFEVFVGHILDSQKLIQDASLEEGECLLAAVLSFSRHLNIPRRPQGPFPCPHGDKTIMFTWKLLGSRDGDPHNDIDTEFSRPKAILDVLVGDVRKHMSSMLASQDAGVLATTPDQRSAAEARKVLDTIYIHGVWSPNANWTEDPARDDHDRLQNGTKGLDYASIEDLVGLLVATQEHIWDDDFVEMFFLCIKPRGDAQDILRALKARFAEQMPNGLTLKQRIGWRLHHTMVHLRIFQLIRIWLDIYWRSQDELLIYDLISFICSPEVEKQWPDVPRLLLAASYVRCPEENARRRLDERLHLYLPKARTPIETPGPIGPPSNSPSSRLDILDFDSDESCRRLAQQLSMFASAYYQALMPEEVVALKMNESQHAIAKEHFLQTVRLHDAVGHWVTKAVLYQTAAESRAQVTTNLIRIARFCEELHNFDFLVAIVGALFYTNQFHKVPHQEMPISLEDRELLIKLACTTDFSNNFSGLRALALEEIKPNVPLIAMHHKTVVHCTEGRNLTKQVDGVTFHNLMANRRLVQCIHFLDRGHLPQPWNIDSQLQSWIRSELLPFMTVDKEMFEKLQSISADLRRDLGTVEDPPQGFLQTTPKVSRMGSLTQNLRKKIGKIGLGRRTSFPHHVPTKEDRPL